MRLMRMGRLRSLHLNSPPPPRQPTAYAPLGREELDELHHLARDGLKVNWQACRRVPAEEADTCPGERAAPASPAAAGDLEAPDASAAPTGPTYCRDRLERVADLLEAADLGLPVVWTDGFTTTSARRWLADAPRDGTHAPARATAPPV